MQDRGLWKPAGVLAHGRARRAVCDRATPSSRSDPDRCPPRCIASCQSNCVRRPSQPPRRSTLPARSARGRRRHQPHKLAPLATWVPGRKPGTSATGRSSIRRAKLPSHAYGRQQAALGNSSRTFHDNHRAATGRGLSNTHPRARARVHPPTSLQNSCGHHAHPQTSGSVQPPARNRTGGDGDPVGGCSTPRRARPCSCLRSHMSAAIITASEAGVASSRWPSLPIPSFSAEYLALQAAAGWRSLWNQLTDMCPLRPARAQADELTVLHPSTFSDSPC